MSIEYRILVRSWLAIASLCVCVLSVRGEENRRQPQNRLQWNLSELYQDPAAWQEAKRDMVARIDRLDEYPHTLAASAGRLLACLRLRDELNQAYARLFTYSNLKYDLDMRDSANLARQQELDRVGAFLADKMAFIEPEILAIPAETIAAFQAAEPGLEVYRFSLNEMRRLQRHTGTAGEERLLGLADPLAQTTRGIYDAFLGAEFPWPEITCGDGQRVQLNRNGYQNLMATADRETKARAQRLYFGRLNDFRQTVGAMVSGQIGRNLFFKAARKYGTCLEQALAVDGIPESVYLTLVAAVNRNLPGLHRLLELRRRILGVAQLHMYDLSTPLFSADQTRYPAGSAEALLLEAFKPLGGEYLEGVRQAFAGNWIDLHPREGKRDGGYANGWAYDLHPYVLFNYQETFADLSGLAHELGHALHYSLANRRQAFVNANPPRFVIEVAATLNEMLLFEAELKRERDDRRRLTLLNEYLENLRVTVFKATLLAEFELRAHRLTEQGEAVTGDTLNTLYAELNQTYFGHARQVCVVDEEIKSGWITVPQLFHSFYAYQYATSYAAASALSELLLRGGEPERRRYLDFLQAGGSEEAVTLLKRAGVDITTAAPFQLLFDKMNRLLDEMEAILNRNPTLLQTPPLQ